MQLSKRSARIVGNEPDGWEMLYAARAMQAVGEPVINLAIGDHDFPTPTPIIEACKAALDAGYHHYADLSGVAPLRQVLAERSEELTGLKATPEQIMVTSGGQSGLYMAAATLLDPGDQALVIDPYYATYRQTFRALGAEVSQVLTRSGDGFLPRPEAIRAAITPRSRVLLINTPGNPTGTIYPQALLEDILALCARHDLWLISDEVYWRMTEPGQHVSPRALPGGAERVVVLNSMSKSHGMTGWRLGWAVTPSGEMVTRMTDLALVMHYGLPEFIQHAAAEALRNRAGEAEIAQIYAQRRGAALSAIKDYPGGFPLPLVASEGGMFILFDVRSVTKNEVEFCQKLLADKLVGSLPGSSFGQSTRGHIRLSLCTNAARLHEAVTRIGDLVRENARR